MELHQREEQAAGATAIGLVTRLTLQTRRGGNSARSKATTTETELHVYVEWRETEGAAYVAEAAPREVLAAPEQLLGLPWRAVLPRLNQAGWRLVQFQMGTGQPKPHWQEYILRRA